MAILRSQVAAQGWAWAAQLVGTMSAVPVSVGFHQPSVAESIAVLNASLLALAVNYTAPKYCGCPNHCLCDHV